VLLTNGVQKLCTTSRFVRCIAVGFINARRGDAVKFYSPYSGLLVVRCDEAQHCNVWAAATLLTEVRRRVVTVRLVVLTGAPQSG